MPALVAGSLLGGSILQVEDGCPEQVRAWGAQRHARKSIWPRSVAVVVRQIERNTL